MDYKKEYEDAIERCKKEFNFNNLAYSHEEIIEKLERVFPELKDNEDEKIRKEIIQSIKGNMIVIHKDKCIAWLEKQGEQKPTWSEKDEIMLNNVISILKPISLTTYSNYAINNMINWLKSIKERIKEE